MMDHYLIYVDGVLKSTIPAGDRTKALVEGVDSSMVSLLEALRSGTLLILSVYFSLIE